MAKTDYYQVLGVNKGASAEELKRAYRKMALDWHPDRHKDNKETAEKKFKEINEAYQVLSDPQKKQAYDQFGHAAFSPGGRGAGSAGGNPFAGGTGGQWGPFTYSYSQGGQQSPFGGGDFGDPFEIFEQFFGGGFRQGPRLPRYAITLDFLEAAHGIEKEVEIEGKRRKIKIPAGVDDGTRINFEDFILNISVRPHDIFERNGSDVYIRVEIPFSVAALGGEMKVPTVSEEVKIKIKPGTQSGTMLRLRGMGINHVRGSGRGDQYVRVNVTVPERLSRDQKRVIEQLRSEGL